MDYKQALSEALTKKWLSCQCPTGEQCWCKVVRLEEPIKCEEDETLDYICPAAALQDLHADHIVKLHNSFLLENSRMDEMADYILKSILDIKDLSPQLAYQITKTIEFSKEFFKNKP